MSEWIDVEKEKPISYFQKVFVTDGTIIVLASWISDPIHYYGPDLMEWDEKHKKTISLDKEWYEPHWLFETGIGPFLGSEECIAEIQLITHWMPLPKPPNA